MTYSEALEYIHSICWMGSRPGLERITELCRRLDNVQDKLKYIHIAGTNGKGSVSCMLSGICRHAGLRTGSFTSPYIRCFNERMMTDGRPIPDADLADIIERIKPIADSMADPPTEFELITAAGLLYFHEQRCDVVVLECGMGGRLDSTNIIDKPLLSVITGIALDHTDFLGDTEAKIATEKAGIIKSNTPVVCGALNDDAQKVITSAARDKNAPFIGCDYNRLSNIELSLDGASFDVEGYDNRFKMNLIGGYQPRNAMLAITAAEQMGLPRDAIYRGVCEARWPARFELVCSDPVVIYDGGHNPQGVEAAVNTVAALFEGKVNVLSGVMADKDYDLIASLIKTVADRVYTVTPDNPRALDAHDYAMAFRRQGVDAVGYDSMAEAVKAAYADSAERGIPLIGMGSLYMYGAFMDALGR